MVVGVWRGYKSNDSHNIGLYAFQMTKNNVMAIILSALLICMTCSSYCWVFVSYTRYFEFRDFIVGSVVMCFCLKRLLM